MKCPRCQRESKDGLVFCPVCGAPLALRAEPAPRPLDTTLPLDRRAGARGPSVPARAAGGDPAFAAPEGDLAAEPARWDLGPPAGRSVRPAAPRAPLDHRLDPGDDLQFGPLPELAPDLAPDLAHAPPPPRPPAREGAPAPARAADEANPLARGLGLGHSPSLDRALGLAPDPVMARDLDLGSEDLDLGPDLDGEPARDLGQAAETWQEGGEGRAEAPREIRLRRPPTWRRVASWAIDACPFLVLWAWSLSEVYQRIPAPAAAGGDRLPEQVLLDGGALALPLLAGAAILALVYHTLAHALAGATLGKWLLGLRLVGPDGRRPSFGRSAARALLTAASVLLLGLGLLAALFTRSGRSLHDISAGTWVVEAP